MGLMKMKEERKIDSFRKMNGLRRKMKILFLLIQSHRIVRLGTFCSK